MNKKISVVISAVVAMVISMCFAVSSFGFVKNDYGNAQIEALSSLGIIDARSSGETVTRGEAVVALVRITLSEASLDEMTPENVDCPYVDLSDDRGPYIRCAYVNGLIGDMPYDKFCENDAITLDDMVLYAIKACGASVADGESFYSVAEDMKIYKFCEADNYVFGLTYGSYAEILWNVLTSVSPEHDGQTYADVMIYQGAINEEGYYASKDIMADYVFGEEHSYVTNAFTWFDAATTESDEETETAVPDETTAPAETTGSGDTSYETEDNSGYSPPFKP